MVSSDFFVYPGSVFFRKVVYKEYVFGHFHEKNKQQWEVQRWLTSFL